MTITERSDVAAIDPAAVKNAMLNALLQNIDNHLTAAVDTPEVQMGILMMAQVMAFRRLLDKQGIVDRGRRMKLISLALADFDKKLRQYGLARSGKVEEPSTLIVP